MSKKKKIFSWIVLAVCTATVIAAPAPRHAAALAWAKHSAQRTFAKFSPEERVILNAIPAKISLPQIDVNAHPTESVEIGSYVVRISKPDSREDAKKSILLRYPRYDVRILRPTSVATADAVSRQLGFKDAYDQSLVAYHTRLDDLDARADFPALRRFLMLISEKPQRIACVAEFDRTAIRGFIMAPLDRVTIVEVFIPGNADGCGVWFTDRGGMADADVHEFLARLEFKIRGR